MITLHTVIGYIVVALSIIVLVWNLFRAAGKVQGNPLRMVFIGLLDLQVLIGIVTWILNPRGGWFILHPVAMVIALALLHVLTKKDRPMRTQVLAYLCAAILLVIGVSLGRM